MRKIILAGTGPAGGEGIVNVTKLSYLDTLHAYATFKDPKELLFFTRTEPRQVRRPKRSSSG